ncbi:MAG: HNH endonuclease signature motif containing protein [Acidimicrobiales bacterium]
MCEIAGVGPVPVAMVRELLDGALVRVVVTKGVDVVSVAHHGRAPNAHQRSALAWMHSRCSVQGCDNAVFIEVDHRTPWRDDPVTAFANLDPLCSHHHYLKERGWHLAPGTGRRPMLPPTPQPRPPATTANPPGHPNPSTTHANPAPPTPPATTRPATTPLASGHPRQPALNRGCSDDCAEWPLRRRGGRRRDGRRAGPPSSPVGW